jgi:hypothetical protein
MTDHADLRLALGSYLAGALDAAARSELEEHLDGCIACREELAELAVLPGFLARLTPGELESGAVSVPEGLLPGLLAQAREISTSSRLRLRRWRMLAGTLGVAAAAALAAAVVVVPSTPSGPAYHFRSALASAPLAGRVILTSRPWGTELTLSLKGLPPGTGCLAVVSGLDGSTQVVGNWGPTPAHSVQVEVATAMPSDELAAITVETVAGKPLLTVRLPAEKPLRT